MCLCIIAVHSSCIELHLLPKVVSYYAVYIFLIIWNTFPVFIISNRWIYSSDFHSLNLKGPAPIGFLLKSLSLIVNLSGATPFAFASFSSASLFKRCSGSMPIIHVLIAGEYNLL